MSATNRAPRRTRPSTRAKRPGPSKSAAKRAAPRAKPERAEAGERARKAGPRRGRASTGSARGNLWVIAAPSGAGKTTLVRKLLERDPRLRFSISYTTREPRKSEKNRRDYFFVKKPTFQKLVQRNAFLEYAQVFDNWYGTNRKYVDRVRDRGYTVLLEIDWQGAQQVRKRAPDAQTIFILPPNAAELERRLRARGTDSEATIQRRLRDSLGDMTHWNEFDHLIVNDDFDAALGRLATVIRGGDRSHRTALPAVRAAAEAILRSGEKA
jgi:guanylate kinase